MENPAAYLKFTPSLAVSLFEGLELLFKFIRSVYSRPFFIDHSTILPSELFLLLITNKLIKKKYRLKINKICTW